MINGAGIPQRQSDARETYCGIPGVAHHPGAAPICEASERGGVAYSTSERSGRVGKRAPIESEKLPTAGGNRRFDSGPRSGARLNEGG